MKSNEITANVTFEYQQEDALNTVLPLGLKRIDATRTLTTECMIFYDEPTSGLDYRNMERVAENIRQLSEMGKTQFVITHDPELVEKCCDCFLFFENGEITGSGSWTAEAVEQVRAYFAAFV